MMIGKYNRILWPLLFAQIVITGIVYFYTGILRGPEAPRMLLTLDGNSVETLRIIGPGEKSVLLEKAKVGSGVCLSLTVSPQIPRL